MTHNKRPPVGATAKLSDLQVMPGDVVENPNNSSRLWSGEKTITPQGWIVDNEGDAWGPGAKYGPYPQSPEFTLISRADQDQATTDAASAANSAEVLDRNATYEIDKWYRHDGDKISPIPICAVVDLQWFHNGLEVDHGVSLGRENADSGVKIAWSNVSAFKVRSYPAPESPWFIPQDGVMYDRVEVKTIGGVLHIREVKP